MAGAARRRGRSSSASDAAGEENIRMMIMKTLFCTQSTDANHTSTRGCTTQPKEEQRNTASAELAALELRCPHYPVNLENRIHLPE